ncbi:MAG: ABC transporter ATP-binding protein [Acetobacteraceae bacterium]
MTELLVQGLSKAFGGQRVLSDVDLTVPAGQLVAILGASGSGKTTLLRLVGGFERADAGTISIGGQIVSGPGRHLPPERRRIGYVAQEGALFPHLSVADNVAFGLPWRQRRRHERVAELLELLGLPRAYAERPPHALSGGEQQRVAVARALAPRPSLVLLDEPFSALDAALRVEARHAVAAALAASGATALLVTHDQAEALSMGHAVAVLRRGVVAQVDTPDRLYRCPADPELAQFIGEAVLLPGVAEGGRAACALGTVRLAVEARGAVELMIRPEQIRLSPARADSARVARVQEVIFLGHEATVRLLLCGGAAPEPLTARLPGHLSPRVGDTLAVSVEGAVMAYPRPQAAGCAAVAPREAAVSA